MHDVARLDQDLVEPTCAVIWHCLQKPNEPNAKPVWDKKQLNWKKVGERMYLCASAQIVADTQLWINVMGQTFVRAPSPRKMGTILRIMADGFFKLRDEGLKVNRGDRVWPMDLKLLTRWARDSGIEETEIQRLLNPTIDENGKPVVLQ
jgi:hypothetical protein